MNDELLKALIGHLADLVCAVSRCADALDVLAADAANKEARRKRFEGLQKELQLEIHRHHGPPGAENDPAP